MGLISDKYLSYFCRVMGTFFAIISVIEIIKGIEDGWINLMIAGFIYINGHILYQINKFNEIKEK